MRQSWYIWVLLLSLQNASCTSEQMVWSSTLIILNNQSTCHGLQVNIKMKRLIPLQIKIIKSCLAKIRQAWFHQVSWHLSMERFESLISLNSLLLLVQPLSRKKSDDLEICSQASLGSAIILCNHDQKIRSPFQKWNVNPPGRNYPLFNNHPYYHF